MTEQGDRPEGEAPAPEPAAPAPEPAAPAPDRPFAGNSAPPPPAAAPVVAWEAPAPVAQPGTANLGAYSGGRPDFTVGALLSDTFARYGASLVRFLAVAVVASGLSWLGSFATPIPTPSSNPFEQPPGSEASGLLGLLGFVVGIISSSAMFAIADSDRSTPFTRVLRRGVDRSGWVFLASLILGVSLLGVGIVGAIVAVLLAIINPLAAILPVVALFLVLIWLSMRLTLALPAVVSDGYDSIQALKLSWRVTKPTGIWLRMLAASLLLGLLVAPGALGAILLFFPTMFSTDRQPALLVLPIISGALLTPLTALIAYSAYRRLVVPHVPRWSAPTASTPPPPPMDAPTPAAPPVAPAAAGWVASDAPTAAVSAPPPPSATPAPLVDWSAPAAAQPVAAPPPSAPSIAPPIAPPMAQVPDASVAAPAFSVPRFGTAAKALLALVLVFDVVGIAAIPYGVSQMEQVFRNGFPGFPGTGLPGQTGAVFPGNVEFGTEAHLDSCTLDQQSPFASRGERVAWLAMLPEVLLSDDEVFLRVSLNETELENTLQTHGTQACLVGQTPTAGLRSGMYFYEVIVNGQVSASGALFVQ